MDIQSDIPLPATHSRKPKWPPKLRALNVGDSFFTDAQAERVQHNLYTVAKRLGIPYVGPALGAAAAAAAIAEALKNIVPLSEAA